MEYKISLSIESWNFSTLKCIIGSKRGDTVAGITSYGKRRAWGCRNPRDTVLFFDTVVFPVRFKWNALKLSASSSLRVDVIILF